MSNPQKDIKSPTELEQDGYIRIRGHIISGGRLGKKAGFFMLGSLLLIVVCILYGVSLNNRGRAQAVSDRSQKATLPAEAPPWWQSQSDAVPVPILPANKQALRPQRIISPVVPPGQPLAERRARPASTLPHPRAFTPLPEAVDQNFPVIPPLANEPVPPAIEQPISARKARPALNADPAEEAIVQAAMSAEALVDGKTSAVAGFGALVDSRSNSMTENSAPSKVIHSPFEVKMGSVIPATLLSAIDSDLPGLIVGQVRQNVYDTASGRYLLIPQGARLVGTYGSAVAYGQARLLVTWSRLIYPNGSSVDLKAMPGTDLGGRSGFDARVNGHTRKLFQGAILLSIIGAGAQLSQPQQSTSNGSPPSVGQVVAGSLGIQLANQTSQSVQRQLNVQPNLRVPTGYEFNVIVDRDIVLSAPYSDK